MVLFLFTMKPEDIKQVKKVLLYEVRPTESPTKVRFGFAELIIEGSSPLSLLNKSDDRFYKKKPTRAWLTAEIEDAIEYFPQLEKAITDADTLNIPVEVSVLNPTIEGQALRIHVVESTTKELVEEHAATESNSRREAITYLIDNYKKTAKRMGKDGALLLIDGCPIFRECSVTFGEVCHRFLEHTHIGEFIDKPSVGIDLVDEVEIKEE